MQAAPVMEFNFLGVLDYSVFPEETGFLGLVNTDNNFNQFVEVNSAGDGMLVNEGAFACSSNQQAHVSITHSRLILGNQLTDLHTSMTYFR